jgi:SAM-dependent methyltransferase
MSRRGSVRRGRVTAGGRADSLEQRRPARAAGPRGRPGPPGRRRSRGAGEAPSDELRAAVQRYYRATAPLYDLEPVERGERFWAAVAAEHHGRRVLELGAGTGRVTALLAARAGRVVAVDLSFDMLERAKRRLRGFRNVQLVLGDMRDLAFRERFDLIVSADADGHLLTDGDRARTFAGVARQLLPGGRFVLDAFWLPEPEVAAAAEGRRVREHVSPLAGRPLRVRESWRCDPRSRRCLVRYEYRLPSRRPVVAEFEARYWSVDELRARCAEAGLTIEAVWGDFDRAPWDERTSPRLIVQARGG